MRRKLMTSVLLISLFLLPVVAGCGTLDMKLHTTIKPSGDLIQQIRLEGTGMMSSFLEEAESAEDLEQGGWEVSMERSDDSVILIATKNFRRDETITFDDEPMLEDISYRVTGHILVKEYFFEAISPGGGLVETGMDGEFEELDMAMLEGMLNISWTFTLPGKVVESNADTIEGNSATWYFDIDSLSSDQLLIVHSRYINWPVIGGIVAAVVLPLALFVLFLIRRRATQAPF